MSVKNYLLIVFFISLHSLAQPLMVSKTMYSVPELVTDVLVSSSCSDVSNISWSAGPATNINLGIGYFSNTNPNFPMSNGIVLSTGNVLSAPKNSQIADVNGWGGDLQLYNYMLSKGISGASFYDASILEFDFKSSSDLMKFNFLFASDEYGAYQCDYSDAFAFFLTNTLTGETKNLALVPGTDVPVSVVSIRNHLYNNSCSSSNANYFGSYSSPNSAINFLGQTVKMEAKSEIIPGVKYHIKLVIADRKDSQKNSAIFIEGGSFSIGADLGGNRSSIGGNALCAGDEYILSAGLANQDYSFQWTKNGIDIPHANSNVLSVTETGLYGVKIEFMDSSCDLTINPTPVVIEFQSPIETSVQVISNTYCNGNQNATAQVVASGGEGAYSYLWNTTPVQTTATATGLVAGSYNVIVTDAKGCSTTATVTITQPEVLQVETSKTNVLCFGESNGTASVTATGGEGAYSYLWNTIPAQTTATATGLAVGAYNVTVTDANGCSTIATVTIAQPEVLEVETTKTDVLCFGESNGTASVTVTGGTGEYTYLWNTIPAQTTATATGLAAGNYTVKVTDANDCSTTKSVTIVQPELLDVETTKTDVLCFGESNGTASVTATGGTGEYTYLWNTTPAQTTATATGLIAGSYNVTVTDVNGCSATTTVTITQAEVLEVETTKTDLLCFGESNGTASVTVSGGTGSYSFLWNTTPAQTTATATGLSAGNYTVKVTDANGCSKTATVSITQPNEVEAPIALPQGFCIADSKTVADLVANGQNIKWYASLDSTIQLDGDELLASKVYYATQTINGCESLERTSVQVSIYNTPAPVSFNQTYCSTDNKTISDLIVQGENVKVYASLNSANALNRSLLLTSGTYYVTQTLYGCESINRTQVNVEIIEVQQILTSRISVCRGSYLQDVIVDGFNFENLRWFNSPTSTTSLQGTTILNASNTYYLEIQQGICSSERVPYTIETLPPVPVPNTENVQYVCGSGLISDLIVLTAENGIVQWYSSLASTTPLAANTRLTTGTYYVSQTIGDCTSVRKAVSVFVLSKAAPTYSTLTVCDGFTIGEVDWILPTGAAYEWYLTPGSQALPANTIFRTGTYYVARNHYGCVSDLKRVQVTVNALPSAPTGDLVQSIALPGTLNDLVMNEAGIVWYLTEEHAINDIGALSPNTPLIDGKVYYGVVENVFGCRSHSTAVRVNLYLSKDKLHIDKLKVYPNPTSGYVNIHYNQEIEKIEVYTLLGNLLQSISPENDEVQIDMSTYKTGTYMLKITVNKASEIIKIIKK